jgi:hypothetical protein
MSIALMRLPQVRERLDVKSNATVRTWCAKHGVEILTSNARARAVRVAELERALLAASRDCSEVAEGRRHFRNAPLGDFHEQPLLVRSRRQFQMMRL